MAVVDLRADRAQQAAKEICLAGGQAVGFRCDVGQEEDVRSCIEKTVKKFGTLSIIVNNAGVVYVRKLHESSEQEWDRLMAVNIKSIFFSLKHGLRHLSNIRRSWIVNIGSISSFVGQANTPAYTTSKHAVLGLTRSIALDYARYGVRCNCVCPGITETPMLREHLEMTTDPQGALSARLRRVAMGVALSPEHIARAVLYLSCDDSFGVTGTSLTIDCGYLAAAEWDAGGYASLVGHSA